MKLTEEQQRFIKKEFGLLSNDFPEMSADEVRCFREKCFNIEVEEAAKADNNNSAMSRRGEVASDLVDIIFAYLKSSNPVAV